MSFRCTPLAAAVALALVAPVHAQQGDGTEVPVRTNVFKPAKVEPTKERIAALKAPEGFEVTAFATGLEAPRMIAVAPGGDVYVTRRDLGDVVLLRDADGDGKADGAPVTVATRPGVHGIALHDGKAYLATVKEIFVGAIEADGRIGALDMIVGDLPDGGQHPNRTLAFGPDGELYVSIGSTCNACNETNPEHATMLRMPADGSSRVIYARGLRNTIGFDWHPTTGELWGMDHGIDFLGDEIQPEELNKLELGRQYGWPHIWGDGGENPQSTPPGGLTKAQWKAASEPMAIGYDAHAAPMAMVFYTAGAFGREYDGDAFVAMRGSWNRNPASGYEVVRIDFDGDEPKTIEPFVTGFLTDGGETHIARPVGLAVAKDGALLLSDDGNGVIYRIAKADGEATAQKTPPADAMKQAAAKGVGVPLATKRDETRGGEATPIAVTSPSFAANAPIPEKHSEYADGVSPALSWKAVPNAKSYVIIVEDPDAKPITPFVHWVAWNIPASVTSLAEGVPEQERLKKPDGVMQGRTSKNTIGYMGPQPPVGDPPHHYHFEVYALDTMLELPVGADRDQVLGAMQGHVIGKGEVVGTYAQKVKPPKAG